MTNLTTTITLLAFALCLTPAINKNISTKIISAAGKLMMPPAIGALVNASGKAKPMAVRALFK